MEGGKWSCIKWECDVVAQGFCLKVFANEVRDRMNSQGPVKSRFPCWYKVSGTYPKEISTYLEIKISQHKLHGLKGGDSSREGGRERTSGLMRLVHAGMTRHTEGGADLWFPMCIIPRISSKER